MNKSKQDEKIIPLVILHVSCNNGQTWGGVEFNGGNLVVLNLTSNTVIVTVFDLLKIRTVCFLIFSGDFP